MHWLLTNDDIETELLLGEGHCNVKKKGDPIKDHQKDDKIKIRR